MKLKIIIMSLFIFVNLCHSQIVVYLSTPNGSLIEALIEEEYDPDFILYVNETCLSFFPDAIILGNASRTYNCHSYAWDLTAGGTVACWIEEMLGQYPADTIPNVSLYWDDGSYEETTESNATKIFYPDGNHSAVKSFVNSGMHESKWGVFPLVRHYSWDGPYPDSNLKYYRLACPKPATNFFNRTITTYLDITNNCNDINVQNVNVQNGAKLKLNAAGDVNIDGTFYVELGSEFEIIRP